jgi:hypothetical protein
MEDSISISLLEEIGSYDYTKFVNDDGEEDEFHPGIDIASDACHGWRKNANDSSVVGMGNNTQKVIRCEHITKADDPVMQRHKTMGTKRIDEFIEQAEGGVGLIFIVMISTWQ